MENEDKQKQLFRIGSAVLILLVALTIGEYLIGSVAVGWWAPLIGIAIIKAFFVVRDYMHIGRLFSSRDEVQE